MRTKYCLVTGVAGDVGFSIGRILRSHYPDAFLMGSDVNEDNPAKICFDQFVKSPYANSENYKNFILELIEKFSINLVIPTGETEINAFWRLKLVQTLRQRNVKVLILDERIIETCLDKYKTYEFLKKSGLNYPKTILAIDANRLPSNQFPMILKPRFGQGSKEVEIVTSLDDISPKLQTDHYLVQELLSDEDQEYTCCVFADAGCYRSIILKRKLKEGFTVSGEVTEDQAIEDYIVSISKALNLQGSMNLQLRMTTRGPVLFEINPRFSSTVMFRDKLGFSDLLWSIQQVLGIAVSDYKPPKAGIKFYRGIAEYIL